MLMLKVEFISLFQTGGSQPFLAHGPLFYKIIQWTTSLC